MKKANLAVMILHYNTPEVTARLCRSVPEAIVIDNGSDPGKQLDVKNRIIRLDRNYGFTGGWNRGLTMLIGEERKNGRPHYDGYWLMNSDIEIERKDVEKVKELALTCGLDIFTPLYNCWIKDCQPGFISEVTELGVIEFTAPVIMRRVIDCIGVFDDIFRMGYGVEYDYCHRARKAGFKIGAVPGASFYHLGSVTIQQLGFKDYLAKAQAEHNAGLKLRYGENHFDIVHKDVQQKSDFVGSDKGSISVYTTIFGNYDTLKPHAWSQIGAKWICITDDPSLKCDGWKTIVVPKMFDDPRKNAKFYKLHPWEVPGLEDARISIFIDGSMTVKSETFIEWLVIRLYNDMLLFRHPERDCIYEEAVVSKSLKYYSGPELDNQIRRYSSLVKPHSGLWACGMLVRKHTEKIRRLMDDWWLEQGKYTLQDQISFAYVCQKNKFIPSTLKENIFNNDLFTVSAHKKDKSMEPVKSPVHRDPHKTPCSDRIRIIQGIIKIKGYTTYLEIGQAYGSTFLPLQCRYKDSIEVKQYPNINPVFRMTSDKFFEHFTGRLQYDMIFIDGDHEREQVLRDIRNSLEMLSPGGCIITHDTNPPNKRFTQKDLCFNAYQALVDVMFDEELKVDVRTVTLPDDQGNGISIIRKAKKKFPVLDPDALERILIFEGFEELRNSGNGWIMEEELYDLIRKK